MKLKKLLGLVAAGAIAFSVAGCGSSSSTTQSATSTTTEAAAPASTAETEATEAAAQDIDWPKKPITVYVPASAGGGTDNTCRVFTSYLEKELGTSIAVVNQTGAAGGIAADSMMAADPDGYTLMYYHNSLFTAYVTGALDYVATDKMKVMDITCRDYPGAICVRADSKYQTLQDLVDDIKANPETVKIGVETGSGSYLQAKLFESAVDGKLKYLDYGSDSERITGLLGGKLDMIFLNVNSAQGYVASNDFRMLGVYGTERNPAEPDLPTCQEQGLDFVWGGQMLAWYGQQDLPDEIVEKFNAAMEKVLENEEVQEKLANLGFYASYEDSETATQSMTDWLNQLMPYKDQM